MDVKLEMVIDSGSLPLELQAVKRGFFVMRNKAYRLVS